MENKKIISNCRYMNSNIVRMEISGEIEVIGDKAFEGCKKLREVQIEEGVKKIGYRAFAESGIEEIIIPESVEVIGDYAFEDCKSLKRVVIKRKGLKELHCNIVEGCINLKEIEIKERDKVRWIV